MKNFDKALEMMVEDCKPANNGTPDDVRSAEQLEQELYNQMEERLNQKFDELSNKLQQNNKQPENDNQITEEPKEGKEDNE